jgi:HTH-type transcriptional regulator/antitoxin HigA
VPLENEHSPIDLPDPIEAIKFRMEQLGCTQTDLAKVVGLKSRASEILSGKRNLSLEMIRQLHDKLNIPTDVLIQAY